jgi:prepilin-type processing-associated H-X9-DG protein
MSSVSTQQKKLLFDYSLGLSSEKESIRAERLVARNKEAAEIHSKITAGLEPLNMIRLEACGDELAERTIRRLCALTKSELGDTKREVRAIKVQAWRNWADAAAVAAVIFLIVSVLIPSFGFARYQHYKNVCQRHLGNIYRCFTIYCSDFDGELPYVETKEGAPWCEIGEEGEENHSVTRSPYLLLKLNYSRNPGDFICKGRKQKCFEPLTISQVQDYDDFPSRNHVSYSFPLPCRKLLKITLLGSRPLMVDRNPVFEKVQDDHFEVRLDTKLSTRNSINHGECGQNASFADGHVEFLKNRHIGIPQDDMFTLQNVKIYRGNEWPACDSDLFYIP